MSSSANILFDSCNPSKGLRRGLTLIELVISIMIAGVMLVSLFLVYTHARTTVDSISGALDRTQVPERILQLIAQDVDRFSAESDELVITPEVRSDHGLMSSRLYLQTQIYDGSQRPIPYERVIWETRYDPESQSMILYRSHSGLVSEDNLLESQRTPEEARAFVPLCSGLTYFKVARVPQGSIGLPTQLEVSISFAEPQTEGGQSIVPPEDIITRTVAVNRLRKIGYIFTEPNLAGTADDTADANAADATIERTDSSLKADPNKTRRVSP